MGKYSVSLKKVVEDNSLGILYAPKPVEDVYVTSQDVNRPGLMLAGYSAYFDAERIQFLGLAEMNYISSLDEDAAAASMERLMATEPVAVVITRSLECPDKLREYAQKYSVPILTSPDSTSGCMSTLISYLGVELAQRITRHGVLVEVSGEGVLILGDSGVGKSETAIELLKRGHRLVADDAVEIRRVSNSLYGTAPEIIRHYIEIRGVGVIDVQQLFGMGAVQFDTEIDLVIQLEQWEDGKFYDRLGLGEEKYTMLDVSLPIVTIPVRPGRNLAGIVEIATMKNRQMKYGYNAARDFVTQFDSKVDAMLKKKSTTGEAENR